MPATHTTAFKHLPHTLTQPSPTATSTPTNCSPPPHNPYDDLTDEQVLEQEVKAHSHWHMLYMQLLKRGLLRRPTPESVVQECERQGKLTRSSALERKRLNTLIEDMLDNL